jgi:carotenoid cleavage dioxygenase-like enzyme
MFSSTVAWCSIAVASAGSTPDTGFELFVTTAPDPTSRTCQDAPGLPDYLQGIYVVSGPAKFETDNYKFQAVFDGFGKLNRFEVGGGQVCYTSAWLNTTFARESEKRGQAAGMLFEETVPARSCPLLDPMCQMKVAADNDWVNLIQIGDDTCLLTDAPQMLKIDLETLDTQETKVWADDVTPSMGGAVPSWLKTGHVGTAGSAHPTRRPGTNTYVDVLSEMGPVPGVQSSFLDVYTFDATKVGPQNRELVARVPCKKTPYLHAFGVTPNYIILPLNHAMNTPNMFHPLLLGTLVEHWDGIRVIDKENKVHSFDTEKFFHAHTVNSFENATGVTMDVGAFPTTPFQKSAQMDIAMFLNKSDRDSNSVRNVVKRLHFHFSGPLAGEVTSEDFDQVPGSTLDFFRIHPDFVGLPYCIFYATQWWADGENYASMAIVKHNVCTGEKTVWQRPNMYPGEPEMVPGPSGAEEDGVVIFVALDGERRASKLVILDAKTFTELEVMELPTHIPFTAHGQFVPPIAGRSMVV